MPNITDAKDLTKALNDIKSELQTLQKRSATQSEQLEAQEKMVAVLRAENEKLKLKSLDGSRVDGGSFSKYLSESGELRLFRKSTDKDRSYGLLDDPKNVSDWHYELKKCVDERNLARACMKDPHTPVLDAALKKHLKNAPFEIREKIFSDSSAIGAEWIHDNMLPLVQQEIQSLRQLESVFNVISVSGGSTLLPYQGNGVRPYLSSVPSTDNPANYTASTSPTSQKTIVPKKFVCHVQLDADSVEDAVIDVLSWNRTLIAQAMASGFEDAIINGDDSATHQDAIASWNIGGFWGATGLGTSADHRRAFQGLRKRAKLLTDMSVDQNSAQTTTGANALRYKLTGGVQRNGGIFVANLQYLIKLSTDANLVTIDKYGPNATILAGEFGSLFGMKVIVSDFMSADLAATGLYTGSGATTGLLYLNKDRFLVAQKRGFNLEMERSIVNGTLSLVGTMTKSFDTVSPTAGAGGEKNVAYGYNLTVA